MKRRRTALPPRTRRMPHPAQTRRSMPQLPAARSRALHRGAVAGATSDTVRRTTLPGGLRVVTEFIPSVRSASVRSEEHTSELQSHVNLVCRLLLEKKKKNKHEIV